MPLPVSTSLNVLSSRPIEESIRRCTAAGFRTFDFNYCDYVRRQLLQQSWPEEEAWAHRVREIAERAGVTFGQMHAPIFNPFSTAPETEALIALSERSMRTAAIVGTPWIVFHPGTSPGPFDAAHGAALLERNVAFVRRMLDADPSGAVGIALEDCHDGTPADNRPRKQFGAIPEELAQLVDALDTPRVGVCWDTGHAHVQGLDHPAALRLLGHRLKVTHIHDNHGRADEHTLPFTGTIKWPEITQALRDAAYRGPISLEVHNSFHPLPDPLKDPQLTFAHHLATHLAAQVAQVAEMGGDPPNP